MSVWWEASKINKNTQPFPPQQQLWILITTILVPKHQSKSHCHRDNVEIKGTWALTQAFSPSLSLDHLCFSAPCNNPESDTLTWKQQWRLKWPLLSFCHPLFFFSVSHRLTSHLQLHKALGMPFISLITCVCQLHICPNALPFTHAYALWGCGFLAAMTQSRFLLLIAKKCVLCRTISPQSPDFLALQLSSTWHRGLVSTV